MKRIIQREEQDRVLKFLTGLNNSFTTTRGQILMMEPKPNISKVFNLISQEERQRSMKSTSTVAFQVSKDSDAETAYVAAYANGYNRQKNRPICSHCGVAGHTIQKCYKLHGYPQGFKNQNKSKSLSATPSTDSNKSTQQWPPRKENVANMVVQDNGGISMHNQQGVCLGSVTSEQVSQLLSVLNVHQPSYQDGFSQISGSNIHLSDGTASSFKPQPHLLPHTPSDIPFSGTASSSHFIYAGMKNGLTLLNPAWIIDTGASCHVCADLTLFLATQSISDTFVTLPDGTRIPVTTSGTIVISTKTNSH